MKTAIATLESLAPYSGSKHVTTPEIEGEPKSAYDERTWREKIYSHPDGRCYIPGQALKRALDATAAQLGLKIKGRGAKTWASLFRAGVLCVEPLDLMAPASGKLAPVMKDEVEYVDVYCDAVPTRKGSSGRVWRRFPIVPVWSVSAPFLIRHRLHSPKHPGQSRC